MDPFNEAAKPPKSARESLLDSIAKTRASLALAEAATRHDWVEVARLQSGGADVMHRGKTALKELAASDKIPVADIMEKITAFMYPPLMGYTLARAAETGNLATIAHIIAKNPPLEMLNHGLCTALLSKQAGAADLLLAAVPEDGLQDNALFGLLVARPLEYARATQSRGEAPDYLMHFLNACVAKDAAAIDLSLERMLAHVADTRRRIESADMDFMDMGGSMLHEMTAHVFECGHLPAIGKFIDAFRNDLMPDFMLLHVALMVAGEQPGVFSFIADKLKVDAGGLGAMVLHGATPDRRPAARYLLEKFPDTVKEDSYAVLRCLAGGDKPQEFFDALDAGVPLPKDAKERARLLAAAIEAKNGAVAAHLEAAMGKPAPEQIAELQQSTQTDVMFRAAQLGGDWHFRGETLFWQAAAEGRRDILDAMPGKEPLQAAVAYQLECALDHAIEANDRALMDDIMSRTPWNDELREAAVESFLAAPQYLPLIDKLGYAPRALKDSEMHAVMHGKGKETLTWLLARGFTMDGNAAVGALEIAIRQNERDAAEYLLGSGVALVTAPRMATMIDLYAVPETLDLLEKWLRRDAVAPANDLRARIAAAENGEALALGVEAAYADVFDEVMRKIAGGNAPGFDPAALCRATDAYGNTILDVLGAHGKLNDILVPELWRDRDAVAFIRSNVPPRYQNQCDFNGLKAALDQLRLKDLGRRARIGLKGP